AAGLEGRGDLFGQRVLGAVHIGGAGGVASGQRVDHRLRLLRGGGAVQIDLTLRLQGADAGEMLAPGADHRLTRKLMTRALTRSMKKPQTSGTSRKARCAAPYC